MYLTFKREYKEFTIIKVNFNVIGKNGEKRLYNEDDFYFEPNNVEYNNIM